LWREINSLRAADAIAGKYAVIAGEAPPATLSAWAFMGNGPLFDADKWPLFAPPLPGIGPVTRRS
jgi:hypothetical protein